jgi:hypothetical protein
LLTWMREQEQLYSRKDCQHGCESRSSSIAGGTSNNTRVRSSTREVEAANMDERAGTALEQEGRATIQGLGAALEQ